MSRMDDDQLPHVVKVLEPGKLTGSGRTPATESPRRAGVHDGLYLVRDERPASDTRGKEVAASCRVFLHPEDYVPVGSTMLVMVGTPAERLVEVVRARLADFPDAPESAQAWGV